MCYFTCRLTVHLYPLSMISLWQRLLFLVTLPLTYFATRKWLSLLAPLPQNTFLFTVAWYRCHSCKFEAWDSGNLESFLQPSLTISIMGTDLLRYKEKQPKRPPIPEHTPGMGQSEDFEYVLCCGDDNVLTSRQASLIDEEKPMPRHLCFPPSCRTRTVSWQTWLPTRHPVIQTEEENPNVIQSCHPPDDVHKRRDDESCRGPSESRRSLPEDGPNSQQELMCRRPCSFWMSEHCRVKVILLNHKFCLTEISLFLGQDLANLIKLGMRKRRISGTELEPRLSGASCASVVTLGACHSKRSSGHQCPHYLTWSLSTSDAHVSP